MVSRTIINGHCDFRTRSKLGTPATLGLKGHKRQRQKRDPKRDVVEGKCSSGFRVWGAGFGVCGLSFGVWGLGSEHSHAICARIQHAVESAYTSARTCV